LCSVAFLAGAEERRKKSEATVVTLIRRIRGIFQIYVCIPLCICAIHTYGGRWRRSSFGHLCVSIGYNSSCIGRMVRPQHVEININVKTEWSISGRAHISASIYIYGRECVHIYSYMCYVKSLHFGLFTNESSRGLRCVRNHKIFGSELLRFRKAKLKQ